MSVELVVNAPSSADCIRIGLVNNMPDGALKATERQFLSLLDSASGRETIQVSLYALPGVPRSETAREHLDRYYCGVDDLWNRHLDGLIVTGTEPRAASLPDEPYWGALTKVIDWAEHNTHSAIWSCLAAHAAVLHGSGIERRRLNEKRFGVFECTRASSHRLTAGLDRPFPMPHSRWNDLAAGELKDCGYQILTHTTDGCVDTFVKSRRSMFVFFQGHPEYQANTLLLEYRRDIGRYLRHERDTYPSMPLGYFDQQTLDTLAALESRAQTYRSDQLLSEFPSSGTDNNSVGTWHSTARRLYWNWLAHLSTQHERQARKLPKNNRHLIEMEIPNDKKRLPHRVPTAVVLARHPVRPE